MNKPKGYDAVLGGQAQAPVGAVVLGGIEGIKHRLASNVVEHRVAALKDALKYGDKGLDLVITAALNEEESEFVSQQARLLLSESANKKSNPKNHRACYWQYLGHSANGKHCPRYDPHGYGVELISEMHAIAEGFGNILPASWNKREVQEVQKAIKLIFHKGGNQFGREVTVIASPETWRKVQKCLKDWESRYSR